MKKEKKYKFNSLGYAQLLLDLRQERINKISGVTSVALIVGLFVAGIIGKELFIIMVGNMGIGKITNWLI